MNLLKSVETTIANLVEGAFGRVFRSEVRPMELARKLAREMDAHRTVSVSRVYVPNEYSVWLSPEDRARYEGVEDEVIDELCAYLLEHARREDLILASQPHDRRSTPTSACRSANSASRRGWSGPTVRMSEPIARPPRGRPADRRARPDDDLQHLGARRAGRVAEAQARRAPRARCSRSAGGGCWCRPGAARSGAAATATSCSTTPASRAATPQIRPDARAGRSRTSARPTACASTAATLARRASRCAPGDRVELGSTEIVFELG